jgi:hypothetical protein
MVRVASARASLLMLAVTGPPGVGCRATPDASGGADTAVMSGSENGHASTSTESGIDVPVCGDGQVEGDEHCDGMPFGGGVCPESCRLVPGTSLWTLSFDGDGFTDRATSVAFGDGGDVLVGGETATVNGSRPIIIRISEAGALVHSFMWDVETSTGVEGLVADGGDTFVVSNNGGSGVDIARFDALAGRGESPDCRDRGDAFRSARRPAEVARA